MHAVIRAASEAVLRTARKSADKALFYFSDDAEPVQVSLDAVLTEALLAPYQSSEMPPLRLTVSNDTAPVVGVTRLSVGAAAPASATGKAKATRRTSTEVRMRLRRPQPAALMRRSC